MLTIPIVRLMRNPTTAIFFIVKSSSTYCCFTAAYFLASFDTASVP
jgi:hypothetical protein